MLEAIVPILLAAWAPFCVGVDAHGFFRRARGDHSFATVSGRDLVRAQYQNLAARKTHMNLTQHIDLWEVTIRTTDSY